MSDTSTTEGRARLVDTHVHLWDPAVGYSWLRGQLRRVFTIDDLRVAMAGAESLPSTSFVVIEADRGRGTDETVEHLLLAGSDPSVAGVVADLPRGVEVDELVALPGADRLLGIRTSGQRWRSLDRVDRVRIGATLADHDLAWELNVAPADLRQVIDLAASVGDLPLVLDHLAGAPDAGGSSWDEWSTAVDRLAEMSNVVIKLSGLSTRSAASRTAALHHVTTRLDPTRTPIGSDWPVCTQRSTWQEAIAQAVAAARGSRVSTTWPAATQEAARRAYPRLSLPTPRDSTAGGVDVGRRRMTPPT